VPILAVTIWLRLLRGDPYSAELAEFDRLMVGVTEVNLQQSRLELLAWKALVVGGPSEARSLFREQAAISTLNAPSAFALAGVAAIWGRDLSGARADLASLTGLGVHGPLIGARLNGLEAGIAALEGRTTEALQRFRDTLQGFRELGDVLEEVLTQIAIVTLLDPSEPDARAAASGARETLTRLGSGPLLARLAAASGEPRPSPAVATPASLEGTVA